MTLFYLALFTSAATVASVAERVIDRGSDLSVGLSIVNIIMVIFAFFALLALSALSALCFGRFACSVDQAVKQIEHDAIKVQATKEQD